MTAAKGISRAAYITPSANGLLSTPRRSESTKSGIHVTMNGRVMRRTK